MLIAQVVHKSFIRTKKLSLFLSISIAVEHSVEKKKKKMAAELKYKQSRSCPKSMGRGKVGPEDNRKQSAEKFGLGEKNPKTTHHIPMHAGG